jgi:hypothetical protein
MTNCLCCDRDAGHRYACTRCVTTMVRWLRDIEDYAVVLQITAGTARAVINGSIGTAFGPRLPIREDVAVFLDYRSRTQPPDRTDDRTADGEPLPYLTADGHDPYVDDPNPTRSLPGSIHGIAVDLRDRLDQSHPHTWSLVSELHYIATQVAGQVHSIAVGDLYTDLKELHGTARSLAHDSPPGKLGSCMSCGSLVYPVLLKSDEARGQRRDADGGVREFQGFEQAARCVNGDCNRLYRGLDLVRLGVAQEASS